MNDLLAGLGDGPEMVETYIGRLDAAADGPKIASARCRRCAPRPREVAWVVDSPYGLLLVVPIVSAELAHVAIEEARARGIQGALPHVDRHVGRAVYPLDPLRRPTGVLAMYLRGLSQWRQPSCRCSRHGDIYLDLDHVAREVRARRRAGRLAIVSL